MTLVLMSIAAVLAALVQQHVPGGHACDVVTPVVAAVGLAAPRGRAAWWAVVTGVLYAAFTRLNPLAVVGVWWALVFVLGAVARRAEWERPPLAFVIVFLASLLWHTGLLCIGAVLDMPPAMDRMAWCALIFRPLTAGLLFLLFFQPLLRGARSVGAR